MAGLPGVFSIISMAFSLSKPMAVNHQVSRLDVSGEGHIDGEEIEAGDVCSRCSPRCPVSPVTSVDLLYFVVNLTCVEGMKRAGWTEVEIPEDLHEMVIT